MSQLRANPSTHLIPPKTQHQYDDSALEGVTANIKLLLKLIQDHKDACDKEKNDSRRMLRVATMITILDNVRDRIQKSQSFGNKRSEADLRRCNTDLRPDNRQSGEPAVDEENERLRKELNTSLAARKSLQAMCSSFGKEKEIMAAQLSRKVQELNGMEELVNDLKAQNQTLMQKVQECVSKHKEKKYGGVGGGESQGNVALQERNKALSEQLLKSLDGYRSMKRKLKLAREENVKMHATMDEMREKITRSLERVGSFKERLSLSSGSNPQIDVQEEIVALESMFECFQMMVAKYDKKQGECIQPKGEISACKPSVLA
ncbi:uncharacterized protein LOC105167275 [Sesamum indicum]|uniref:Uncharacterized protein LOC105167275 n=1 Tax=Sesamum indicum TaxID=4182 RepID=A0A6I9TI37_SESIN|nr:uncharacterized protein LOC105167275 [Sesamum indicum]